MKLPDLMFYGADDLRNLHSFPTRRSSDLFDVALEERATELASEALREVRDHLATAVQENGDLRMKLDALALEVARREGELHTRSEEHTSELQSLRHLVCRLLLEKKKRRNT